MVDGRAGGSSDAATEQSGLLPDVLYIGLQKTGSTFLRAYFASHPGIVWTRQAYRLQSDGLVAGYPDAARAEFCEQVANRPSNTSTEHPIWIDMYEGLGMDYVLAGADRWDPALMMSSASLRNIAGITVSPPGGIAALRRLLPHARVLLTIRDQVEWIFSNYHHYLSRLPAHRRTLPDFLATIEGRVVLSSVHYDRLVVELFEHFGRDRVCVLTLEEIETDTHSALAQLSRFLGCAYVPFAAKDSDYNRGIDSTLSRGAGEPSLGRRLATGLPALLASKQPRLEANDHIKTKDELRDTYTHLLTPFFAASNLRLERLLGKSLAAYGYAT